MEKQVSKLVLADFDETIIDCDSLVTIMKKEKWFLDISLIWAGIGIVCAKVFKGDVYKKRSAFKYIMMQKYNKLSDVSVDKYTEYFKNHLNSEVLTKIQEIDADKIVIASASAESLIRKVLEGVLNVDIVIANVMSDNKKEFKTCYGQQKADRVCQQIPDYKDYEMYVFSDSMSDKPIFDLGKIKYLVKDGHLSQI